MGDASVESDAGFLDLADAARAGSKLTLSWDRVEGRLVTNGYYEPALPDPLRPQVREERGSEAVRFGPGDLANLTCWAPCQVLVVSEGGGRLALDGGRADGEVQWTREASHRHAGYPARGDPQAFYYDVGAGWLLADTDEDARDALPLAGASPRAEGRVTLLLVNATAVARADGGTHALDARSTVSADALGTRRVGRFYLLQLEGARLAAEGPARLGAPAWRLASAGDASSERATGWLDAGDERRAFADERVFLRGDLAWDMRAEEGGLVVRDARLTSGFQGSLAFARIGSEVVKRASAPEPARLAAGAAVIALTLAAFALYSRLERPDVAAHPHRQRIQAELRGSAGLGPTELARRLGLARVVVQHHLRVLHRHGMVVRKERGTALVYFLPEAAPDAPSVTFGVALRNATTARLARALADAPTAASQLDLSARTGIHPRLVSYHLGKLGRAGLVVVEPGTPQRYAPAPGFREFVCARR